MGNARARNASLAITHFSDVLCVWAYAPQVRFDEIGHRFGESVKVNYPFCSVFGDSSAKIALGWADKGGYEDFNRYLQEVEAQFSRIEVHPDVWLATRSPSSDSAHLFINVVRVLAQNEYIDVSDITTSENASTRLIWHLRSALFHGCRNVSMRSVQFEV